MSRDVQYDEYGEIINRAPPASSSSSSSAAAAVPQIDKRVDSDDDGYGVADPSQQQRGDGGYGAGNVNTNQRHTREVAELRQLWINERGAPELLYYDSEIINVVQYNVTGQQEVLEEQRMSGLSDQNAFRMDLLQMEIDRVSFLLSAYHRVRLQKIEKNALHILMTEDMVARLSEHEFKYLKRYVDLLETHFNQSLLHDIPERFQSLTDSNNDVDMIQRADLNAYVFLRVNDNVGPYSLSPDGDDFVELNRDDILVASYRNFRSLLGKRQIGLI